MYGERVHRAVIAAGEKESGITVHYVNGRYDDGAAIFRAVCPVAPDDTPETLAAKVHALEYAHFPQVIKEVADNLYTLRPRFGISEENGLAGCENGRVACAAQVLGDFGDSHWHHRFRVGRDDSQRGVAHYRGRFGRLSGHVYLDCERLSVGDSGLHVVVVLFGGHLGI